MHYMINLGHPAHVHFFRPFIQIMEGKGHSFQVTAREKEVTEHLLHAFAIPYTKVSHHGRGTAGKAAALLQTEYELLKLAKARRPDAILGISNMYGAHVAKLLSCPSFVFTDTEHAALENGLAFPFATRIVVPSCYKDDLEKYGEKAVRYAGYHELAYLHPARFKADPSVLEELGVATGERYVIVRFVSWRAAHDAGHLGFDLTTKSSIVRRLSSAAKVFVSSEEPLPPELEPFKVQIAPERMHDALAFAALYLGEGATMASECAVLGTPAIYLNSLTMGYTEEEESRYQLIFNFSHPEEGLKKAVELLSVPNLRELWAARRARMIGEKVDVTQFMVDLVEREMAA